MIFESVGYASWGNEEWRLVVVRREGVFFIGGSPGFEKAEPDDEAEWRKMPPNGNQWWKRVR